MSRSLALPVLLALGLGTAVVLGPLGSAPAPDQVGKDLFEVTLVGQTGSSKAGQTGQTGQTGQPGSSGDGSATGTFEIKSGVTGLYPGASRVIVMKIENYSSSAIRVTELAARVRTVTAPCVATQLLLGPGGTGVVTGPTANHPAPGTGQPLTIAGGGTGYYAFPVAMQPLPGKTDDRCQAATWNLDYSGKAVKA